MPGARVNWQNLRACWVLNLKGAVTFVKGAVTFLKFLISAFIIFNFCIYRNGKMFFLQSFRNVLRSPNKIAARFLFR